MQLQIVRRKMKKSQPNPYFWEPSRKLSRYTPETSDKKAAIIKSMDILHMTEAEVVRDIAAVFAKVRQGTEIVVEEGDHPMAVIKPSRRAGRMISEVIADLKARGSGAAMDAEFARDIEEGIKAHQQPWNPPSWD